MATAAKVFKKATKHQLKLRLALSGVSGGGKTYTALRIATNLVPGGKIAVIDTERESASLYADEFTFDTLPLESFHPREYVEAIEAAESAGYDVIIIDSLTHAWAGKGGVLEEKDKIAKRQPGGNSYTAWNEAGRLQDELVDAILRSRCHVIVTLRSKMDHVQEKDDRTGKTVVRKVGMKVVQRDDLEYEFTVWASMTHDNTMVVEKTRCAALNGAVIARPGKEIAETLRTWLASGATEAPVATAIAKPAAAAPAKDWDAIRSDLYAKIADCRGVDELVALKSEIDRAAPKGSPIRTDVVEAMKTHHGIITAPAAHHNEEAAQ